MGYIQIDRELLRWSWADDVITFGVYVKFLMMAVWKDTEYHGITLKRGELPITQSEISATTNLTRQQTRTVLNRLRTAQKLTTRQVGKISIITLIDYDVDAGGNHISTTYQPLDNQVSTTFQPDSNQPSLLNKKNKEVKEVKEHKNARACAREMPEPNAQSPTAKKPNTPEKRKFAEFVSMTNDEYSSLVTKLGEQGAKRCIEILDNYKGQSGKTYKSDYRAILNWVITRYNDEQAQCKQQAQSKLPGTLNTGNPFLDMLREIEEREANEIDIQGNFTDNGNT